MIKVLSAGNSFGELALIDSQKRTATIVAKTSTHLVSMTKEGT
jgi:CRP-like cAMP-binding protein